MEDLAVQKWNGIFSTSDDRTKDRIHDYMYDHNLNFYTQKSTCDFRGKRRLKVKKIYTVIK